MRRLLMVGLSAFCIAASASTGGFSGPKPGGVPTHGPIIPRAQVVVWPLPSDPSQYLMSDASSKDSTAPVLSTHAVFWGARWLDKDFAGDKIRGLDQFYRGWDQSSYSMLVGEYMTTAGPVLSLPRINYKGHVIDAVPDGSSQGDPVLEICRLIENGRLRLAKGRTNYIPIYAADRRWPEDACGAHGTFGAEYCPSLPAGTTFVYAAIPNVDSDRQCGVGTDFTGHSKGLASLANTSARAIVEVQTDPEFWGWHDSNGNEMDDKCAYIFSAPYVELSNHTRWKLQDLWSNAAFLQGVGQANFDGAPGCVTAFPSVGH